MESVTMSLRMDAELKRQAEDLFSDLGLNMSTAINIFVRKAVREQRIPFELSRDIPNKETLEAMEEIRRLENNPDKKVYVYDTFEDFMKDMDIEDEV